MLSAAASLLVTGCIIPDAPEYGPAQQTPVFIVEGSIFPNPRGVVPLEATDDASAQAFKFKVRSEDAGNRLYAVMWSDYKHTGGKFLIDVPYAPLTFDIEREISLELSPTDNDIDSPACHVITIMVLHEAGWDPLRKRLNGNPADLAAVNWFVSVSVPDAPPPTLDSCPDPGTEMSAPVDEK
jgi:hypothetical protein